MLSLVNLDDRRTRNMMLDELANDIASNQLYLSPRLTVLGRSEVPRLLEEAIINHDDAWLAAELRRPGLLKRMEERVTRGVSREVKVPTTASETLAEGEFNRYYIRGVCRLAVEESIEDVEVYRAKEVMNARSESIRKIGSRVSALQLLSDLRVSIGIDTVLGLPPGPNSGLSVRIPSIAK